MSAHILPFKKDMHAELDKLTIFGGQPAVEDLMNRHEKIRLMHVEAFAEADAGLRSWSYVDPITWAYDYFHRICARSGVSSKTIEEFNEQREDWKRYAVMRSMMANW